VSGAELVKIGITSGTIERRLFSLQTGSPVRLTLLGYVIVSSREELRVHNALRAQRQHGEWFRRAAIVDEFVSLIASRDAPALEDLLIRHRC
jgi:hypothetical protein